MKAELMPLEGKHYGSIIKITDGKFRTEIKVWHNADYTPSDRELADYGATREDWDNNRKVDGCVPICDDLIADCHFESQWQYELCLLIVDAINSRGE